MDEAQGGWLIGRVPPDYHKDSPHGPAGKVTELIRSDAAKWKKVIDEAGIKVE